MHKVILIMKVNYSIFYKLQQLEDKDVDFYLPQLMYVPMQYSFTARVVIVVVIGELDIQHYDDTYLILAVHGV